MNLEDLEEALADILPAGFQIEIGKRGQLVVYTNLLQDEDGELVDFDSEESEDLDFDSESELPSLDDEDEDE